jgi:SAM-dependent methyltransferase
MSQFKDHFSGHARGYADYRPGYPPALFAWLATLVRQREVAWDCATGNGQAALGLAPHFERVIASDASAAQIANRREHANVAYYVSLAEASALRPASCDLVAVAQSIHWFDFERFYAEVRRVLRPGGVLVVWTYTRFRVDAAIDALIDLFYTGAVGPYWPPERQYVDDGYRTIPFPFEAIAAPPIDLSTDWSLAQVLQYLGTWSAVQRFRKERGSDPVAAIAPALAELWGEGVRTVNWPLHLRAGRV